MQRITYVREGRKELGWLDGNSLTQGIQSYIYLFNKYSLSFCSEDLD